MVREIAHTGLDMSDGELVIHEGAEAFARAVRPLLEQDEAANGLMLGVLAAIEAEPPPAAAFMAKARQDGQAVAAALFRDLNLIVTRGITPFAGELCRELQSRRVDPPGVIGPAEEAEAIAEAWADARGCRRTPGMAQGLYRLERVVPPEGVPGRMRVMAAQDIPLVSEWLQGFHRDALPHEAFLADEARRNAETRVARGLTHLWEVDGRPVAMAALTRPTAHGITINAVYTPPALRRRGYATALVAALSAEGLRRGKRFCMLYTDLGNPTSNSIYRKVGYTWVMQSALHRFDYGTVEPPIG